MFMKHTISRFFRFFLVAALVAAMAGSLLPSKVVGQTAEGDETTTTVSTSTQATGASPDWTIEFESESPLAEDGNIVVDFDGASVPSVSDLSDDDLAAAITVQSGDGEAMTVEGTAVTRAGDRITIQTPVVIGTEAVAADEDEGTEEVLAAGGTGTINISSDAMITLGAAANTATAWVSVEVGSEAAVPSHAFVITTAVTVERSMETAGSVAQWQIGFTPVEVLSANASLITLKFSHASVPADVASNDISVLAIATVEGTPTTIGKLLEVAPTRTSSSITFFTPVTANPNTAVKIVVATTAGVANGLRPTKTATVKVTSGTNAEATSGPLPVIQYVSFSPTKATRNATVTVNGGGFTSGTSGGITVGEKDNVGTYTVDSSGKLSGSFVAGGRTSAGGKVTIEDLGSGEDIMSAKSFTQLSSATPTSEEVALGAPVQVTLNDFDAEEIVTAVIAGDKENPISPNELRRQVGGDE